MTKHYRDYNTSVLPIYFTYDPDTGCLSVNDHPMVRRAVQRINKTQYRVGYNLLSVHRIIWAMHHPKNPNPKYVIFKDGNKDNTRIENLEARDVHPRWDTSQGTRSIPMRRLPNGTLVPVANHDQIKHPDSDTSSAPRTPPKIDPDSLTNPAVLAPWERAIRAKAKRQAEEEANPHSDRAPITQEDLDFFENMAKVSPEEEERRRLVEQLKNEDWD